MNVRNFVLTTCRKGELKIRTKLYKGPLRDFVRIFKFSLFVFGADFFGAEISLGYLLVLKYTALKYTALKYTALK